MLENPSVPRVVKRRRWQVHVLRLALLALGGYLGVLLVLMALENRLLYYPVRATDEWVPPPDRRVQDIELHIPDGTTIHAWWYPPEKWESKQGAQLFCHGNGGNLSYASEALPIWQQELHTAIFIFDYPGYGKSGGQPNEAGCYASGAAAYDWLVQTMQIPPERILLFGDSLGGGVAVDLASRLPHRALILSKTFTSIPDMAQKLYPWLPARWIVRHRFDNLAKIRQCTRPLFMTHGTMDRLVPFSQGERLFAAASEPKRLLPIPGADHNDGLGPDFFPALNAFLKEYAD